MENKYHHIRLEGERSIRVLELEPAPDALAPIICNLRAISLNDYPEWKAEYTALSYTWDGQELDVEIECRGRAMLITRNCDEAIRSLRSTTERQVLWIDSICIDQSNFREATVERNGQVALMGEIYKSAARVVIWLGQGKEPVEAAMRHVMEIANIARAADLGEPGAINYANRRATQIALRQRIQNISNTSNASNDPFGPLFECSWFHRVWTIQECTLPSFDRAVVRCGIVEILWGAVFMVADLLVGADYRWGRYKEAMELQKRLMTYLVCQRIPGAKDVINQNEGRLQNDPLMFSILEGIRPKQASNPKDKIIGLYGLLKELEIDFPVPNYDLSVEDVFREATVASIEKDGNLHLLYQAPSDRREDSLASWVPDYREISFKPSDMRHAVIGGNFAASGHGASSWRFTNDHRELVLRGKIVDTVVHKYAALPEASWNSPESQIGHNLVMRSWVEVSRRVEYPTGEHSKQALKRTLVYDQPENTADAVSNDAFGDWYDNMCSEAMGQVARGSLDTTSSTAQNTTSDAILAWKLFGTNHFHSLALMFSARKCFFSTAKNYFGTAPDPLPVSIIEGDKVALVNGLEMLLHLRPVGDRYKLITHVYVHRIMYREMWPETKNPLEDIVLV